MLRFILHVACVYFFACVVCLFVACFMCSFSSVVCIFARSARFAHDRWFRLRGSLRCPSLASLVWPASLGIARFARSGDIWVWDIFWRIWGWEYSFEHPERGGIFWYCRKKESVACARTPRENHAKARSTQNPKKPHAKLVTKLPTFGALVLNVGGVDDVSDGFSRGVRTQAINLFLR